MIIAPSTLLPLGHNDHRLRLLMVKYSLKLAYLGVFIVLRQNIPFNISCSQFYKPNCRPLQKRYCFENMIIMTVCLRLQFNDNMNKKFSDQWPKNV